MYASQTSASLDGGLSSDLKIRLKDKSSPILSTGCLLAGIFIVATGYTQQRRTSVIFLVLGVGFSGLNAIGYAVNHLDIAPPFAGVLMGLTNTFASTPGFISPQITGFVTSNKVGRLLYDQKKKMKKGFECLIKTQTYAP